MNAHDYRLHPEVRDDWYSCEKCRTYLMPLDKFEVVEGSSVPGDNSEPTDPLSSRNRGYSLDDDYSSSHRGPLDAIFDYFWSYIDEWRRRKKLAKLKAEVLPRFPQSQVPQVLLHQAYAVIVAFAVS